jgi:hypothetical protein
VCACALRLGLVPVIDVSGRLHTPVSMWPTYCLWVFIYVWACFRGRKVGEKKSKRVFVRPSVTHIQSIFETGKGRR